MALVRIETDTFGARVYSPYSPERVQVIRTIPGRWWDKDGKYWSIPVEQVPSLIAALRQIGDTVQVDGTPVDEPPTDPSRLAELEAKLRAAKEHNRDLMNENAQLRRDLIRARQEIAAKKSSWAEELLSRLSPDQQKQVYRKLATVLHPDVGGSHELMRDLNMAHDLLNERSWR